MEKDTTLNKDSNDFDLIQGLYSMEAKGKTYSVKVMPLAYAMEYIKENAQFITTENNSDFRQVLINFMEIDNGTTKINMNEMLEKWVPRLLEYKGKPCTLDMLLTHNWDIIDLNTFLKKAVGVSG